MPSNPKFPPTVEIKRVIASVIRAGIEIGSIEIYSDRIIIHPKEENSPPITEYDIWKMSEGRDSSLLRHTDEQSGAQQGKSKT